MMQYLYSQSRARHHRHCYLTKRKTQEGQDSSLLQDTTRSHMKDTSISGQDITRKIFTGRPRAGRSHTRHRQYQHALPSSRHCPEDPPNHLTDPLPTAVVNTSGGFESDATSSAQRRRGASARALKTRRFATRRWRKASENEHARTRSGLAECNSSAASSAE